MIDFRGKVVGRIEKIFGRGFDFFELIFLGGGDRGGKKLRREINNSSNAGFKFKTEPKEKISFFDSNGVDSAGVGLGLTTDEPH
jgi:hypothetical protein